tara:strand:- start:74 stop:367 length:294 start_codon:yes stop_codon:yes gene_type:complete
MYYDYICSECGFEKEVSHSIKEEPIIECGECNTEMKRIISGGTGFILKGIGWSSKGTSMSPTPHKITTKTLVGKKETPNPKETLGPIVNKAEKRRKK